MKNVLFALLIVFFAPSFSYGQLWQRAVLPAGKNMRVTMPVAYLAYTTDEVSLKAKLFSLSNIPAQGQVLELPLPDGSFRSFRVWHSPMMPDALAAKYPELRTFTAEAIDNPNITAKLDLTTYGFHAIIFDGVNISFIDPSDNFNSGYYIVHFKKDERRANIMQSKCLVQQDGSTDIVNMDVSRKAAFRTSNGYMLRSYRLALACNHQYAQAATGLATPSIAQVFSKMLTSMNRVNGVYEREFSVSMNLVANEDAIIWTIATGGINGDDPYNNDDPNQCIKTNQMVCDTNIGTANYDIGHVFTTGSGGLSLEQVICVQGSKAKSVTGQPTPVGDGFDIDFVSHEMGHEYGADHSFNNGIDGNCEGVNINPPTAYEPGSGSTIMAYAGICPPDDLQPHSDPYFHAISLLQIQDYLTTGGDVCAVKIPTGNKLLSVAPFTASYTIPYLTPFELTAPVAVDSAADTSITYCWEQWNLGDVGQELINTHDAGPIFRSYIPVVSPTRVFPRDSMVLAGVLSNAGTENHEGEKAPDVARYLTFKLTLRDVYQGTGCFLVPDDSIHLDVVNTGAGFTVTSQDVAGLNFLGNSIQKVTWDVVGTNMPPVNTPNVDIYLSGDGGYTWPYHIGTFINNGSVVLNIPNPDTTITHARLKVKGAGNVFFNVNRSDFTVTHNSSTDNSIKIYPVPARSTVRVVSGSFGYLDLIVYNALGQEVYRGSVNGELDIAVNYWARGMYFMRLTDVNNNRTVKKFVVE